MLQISHSRSCCTHVLNELNDNNLSLEILSDDVKKSNDSRLAKKYYKLIQPYTYTRGVRVNFREIP